MRPFVYQRAEGPGQAVRLGQGSGSGPAQADAEVQYLAGGTTLVDLMKLEVLRPVRVVDINPLSASYSDVQAQPDLLRLGALAKMSAVAAHPVVARDYPVIAQSLALAASAQLRNMATLGGNVLQRTRCPYYRDTSWTACNKRRPGSGCAAIQGFNRNHAVLGVDATCIAQYPGDFAVALAALDAQVELVGPGGARMIGIEQLHTPANGRPDIEHTLGQGELITALTIHGGPWTRRSRFVKIRDRASYEFAIASAAVALHLDGGTVRVARIGLGGVAYRPWRAREAEALLVGQPVTEATAERAARAALAGAVTHGDNDYKPALARRTLVRALLETSAMEI